MTCDPWFSLRWWEWWMAGFASGFVFGMLFLFWVLRAVYKAAKK